jgi:H+/Na+-translocating ferredoxin:NAD+ oxidoreductase subunit E
MIFVCAVSPLIAISDTLVNAIGLAGALLLVVPLACALTLLVRRWLDDSMLLVATLLITAGLVASVELLMSAWFHDLRESLGVFVALLVANTAIIGRMDDRSRSTAQAWIASTMLCIQIGALLLLLGAAREFVGRGSLLHDAEFLFGPSGRALEINLFSVDLGFLLAMLPPGAFISLGLFMAVRNWYLQRRA